MNQVLIFGGGINPLDNIHILKGRGIKTIFALGTRIKDIATLIRKNV